MTIFTASRLRGYTLIEIAMALVVLGILLSAVITPLQLRVQVDNERDVRAQLENIRSAVSGYAVIHRTTNYRITDVLDDTYELPAGRPYLPCPDITGDGRENRNNVIVDFNVPIDLTGGVASPMLSQGNCIEQKGLLPWRTLGLQSQVDPWGRQFAYWVDVVFSNSILGFDETFRADSTDPRLPLVVTDPATGEVRYANRAVTSTPGGLVCSDFYSPSGGCPSEGQRNLIAGIVTSLALTIGARQIAAYDSTPVARRTNNGILEGAAFVVVSHGQNGYGGIRREGVSNRCMAAPVGRGAVNTEIGEMLNAYYDIGHPFLSPPFDCTDLSAANPGFAENLFVSHPVSKNTQGEDRGADDYVSWTSPNMLFGILLQSSIFPVPRAKFLPENR